MKYLYKHLFLQLLTFSIIAFISSCNPPQGQRGYEEDFPPFINENFYFDPLIFLDEDSLKPRLDLYIEIPTENLLFKFNSTNDKYESEITLAVYIKTQEGKPVIDRFYEELHSYTKEQMKEISKESHFYLYNYNIEPGKYKLEIKIKDKYSESEFNKSSEISVRDFTAGEITASDIMILSRYKIIDEKTNEITPLISNNIFGYNEFYIFFELYNKKDSDAEKEYSYKIKDNKNTVIKEELLSYTLSPGINKKFEKISIPKELAKYLPEEDDFDLFLFDREDEIFFKLELTDISGKEVIAGKKLIFIPDKRTSFKMHRKPDR